MSDAQLDTLPEGLLYDGPSEVGPILDYLSDEGLLDWVTTDLSCEEGRLND